MHRGQLITASCTTGWLDWIHSELWLFDDGLLVAKTSLWRTILNGVGPTVAAHLKTRDFTSAERAQAASSAWSNRWLDASELTSARFHAGLGVWIVDFDAAGVPVKLLWLQSDQPEGALRQALQRWGASITD